MGERQVDQAALFYEFWLERHVPASHLLRSIDRFVDLWEVRNHLAPRVRAKVTRYRSLFPNYASRLVFRLAPGNATPIRHQLRCAKPNYG